MAPPIALVSKRASGRSLDEKAATTTDLECASQFSFDSSCRHSLGSIWSADGGGISPSACSVLRRPGSEEASTTTTTPTPRTIYHPKSFRSNNFRAPDFALATLRFVKGKLYGRDQVIASLRHAVTCHSLLLLAGTSGVGKSSLVGQLRQPTEQQVGGGIYALGKYSFSAQSIPYPGITEATRKICHALHVAPHHVVVTTERIQELRHALGSSVYILANLLPELLELLQLEEDSPPCNTTDELNENQLSSSNHHMENVGEFQNRFRFALGTFIRVVAGWMPVVMVLDDLHWADSESLDLVTSWIHHDRIPGLVLVGCYRSEEVDDTHIMRTCLREWQTQQRLVHVELHNLNQDAVNEMLADVLHTDLERTKELARVVHKKTMGNPFFVIQYLRNLYQLEILTFSMGLTEWIWKLEEIEERTRATDNVVQLMQTRMQTLPPELCHILPLAACLGSSFQANILSVLVDSGCGTPEAAPESEMPTTLTEIDPTARFLELCVEDGFLIQDEDGTKYTWMHDKIEEAALSIIDPKELERIQFSVGRILLAHLSTVQVRQNVFVVVNLLNKGLKRIDVVSDHSTSIRTDIARLNLLAGQAAMDTACFAQAASYLKNGIEWLPKDQWTNHYELCLELYTSAAEAEYGAGEVESSEAYARIVIGQEGCPFEDKLRAYSILIPCIQGRDQMSQEASNLAVYVLDKLGCKLPKRGQLFFVLRDLRRLKSDVKKLIKGSIEMGSKRMKEDSKIRAMRLMDKLVTLAYHTGSLYLPLAVMKGFRWIARYGLSEYAPASLSLVGLLLMSQSVSAFANM